MISSLISVFIMILVVFNIWSGLSDLDIDWKNKKTWLLVLISTIAIFINFAMTTTFFKVINVILIFIAVYKYLFKLELKQSFAAPIIVEFLYIIAETIFSIILVALLKDDVETFINNYAGSFITNLTVSGIVYLFSKIKFVKLFINFFDKTISRIDKLTVITLSILSIFIYTVFGINVYYGLNPKLLMILSVGVSLISFILVCIYFKVKTDFYKMSERYNSSLLSLREFEDVLNDYRIDNHENKNHLLTIRNMTTSKKIKSFVDTILDTKTLDNKVLIQETSSIPAGGLRGLVYSKLLVMEKKEIDYELNIASSIRIVNFSDYGDATVLDMCKIVGVFLDNAIEEVNNIEDKYIVIEIYTEKDKIIASITNTYDNTIKKDNIYKVGYSTKGGGHGYGLSLVKKLVKNNSQLKTHHEISDNEFTQIVEMKKEKS